ncbi:MAG: hypothetical protein SVR94_12695, partial [Pseudomonadota bacterium]|nr:hypothetical protein [Pseudomonadota bacterium]
LKKYFEQYRQLLSASADLVVHDEANWFIIAFEKPLADFDATAKPLQAIHNWFVEHMRLLRQFADKTPELNWNFPPQ